MGGWLLSLLFSRANPLCWLRSLHVCSFSDRGDNAVQTAVTQKLHYTLLAAVEASVLSRAHPLRHRLIS